MLTVGIPIYLHLYFRRKPLLMDFPSLRLIRLSVQAMVRRMKIRNILLLILRLLVILLLVGAFAKPFWGMGKGSAGLAGDPSAFVIILDNSLSMGASHRGISLFNTAKSKGLEILDKMGVYDKASIVLLNDPGSVLFSQLSWDKVELKEAVREAGLSMAGTNLFSALQSALKLLNNVKSYKRSIYLITDTTRQAWKPLLDSYDLKRIDPTIDLILIPVGTIQPANLTMADMEVEAPIVLKGRPVPLFGTVWNQSDQPQKTRVSVHVNGDKKHEEALELEPLEKKRFSFVYTFPEAGISHVRMSLPGDALAQDDVRHLAVKVLAPQPVLLLTPALPKGRIAKDDVFLKFALNPMARRERATFVVESRHIDEAKHLNFENYSIIYLLNQKSLPDEMTKRLSQYVFGGGNLVIFLGPLVDPSWYNLHLNDKLGGKYLLPGRLVKRLGNAVSKAIAYQLTDLDFGHPAFHLFQQEGNGDPGRVQIHEYYQIEANSSALVLARMNHGLPAILEEARGQGRTMLIAFTADREWTNWPLKPTFLPFLQQSALGMISKQGLPVQTVLPGTPVSIVRKQQGLKRVLLHPPKGAPRELPIKTEGEGLLHLSTTETDEVGFYRLEFVSDTGTQVEAFSVNPPPEEGNLEPIPINTIPRFIPIDSRPGARETFGDKISTVREGRELASGFFWALVLILLAETVLANFTFSPKGSRA